MGQRNCDTVVARASYDLRCAHFELTHRSSATRGNFDEPSTSDFERCPSCFPRTSRRVMNRRTGYVSVKLRSLPIRRILLSDGVAYSVRPSFVMPYMTGARTENVQGPLFLRKFGVPFWALAYAFGHSPMYWCRMECGFGRFSVVGTTVRQAALPEHVLADEHHQTLDGAKVYIATTVATGCVLGAEPAETAGTDDLESGLRGLQGRGP